MADEKMVSIPQKQLDEILDRLAVVEKDGKTNLPITTKRVLERTAKIRVWNGKIVLGIKKVEEILNERTQKEETKATILLDNDGKDEIVEVDYIKFLNSAETLVAKVLEQKAKEVEKSQGVVSKIDHNTDRPIRGEDIDLIVTSVEYISKLKVLTEGKFKDAEVTLPNTSLNI